MTGKRQKEPYWTYDPETGCWPWLGASNQGYGTVWMDGKYKRAHRVTWSVVNGPIPDGMVIRHRCDNPPCVNPDHLELGTQGDNMRDRAERGPARTNWRPRKG